jgi:hypothetical protein
MLNDQDAIDDVNPFVTHDFSLPGGTRQTSNFDDFVEEMPNAKASSPDFCNDDLSDLHPRRNIDCEKPMSESETKVVVGISNKTDNVSVIGYVLCATIVVYLILLYARR